MENIMFYIPVIGTVGSFALMFLLIWSVARTRQRKHELQAQVQTRLIERFNSAPELIQFLQSNAGQQFVNGVQRAPLYIARNKVVSGISRAIILASIGLAFVVVALVTDLIGIAVPGILFLCLGGGYFAATYVSMRMSERLGLVDEPSPYQPPYQQPYQQPYQAPYQQPQAYTPPQPPPAPAPSAVPLPEEQLPQI
ncbi:MAG TPA: hypothetical protein VGF69_04205 [Thermoanaerobaculia bacterium]|jgi:hypothetical protein